MALRGLEAVSSVSPATAIGAMGFAAESLCTAESDKVI